MDKYGQRALSAEINQGIDYKAISHAVRAIYQTIELFDTKKIIYPLKDRELLIDIKTGKYNWKELEDMIVKGLENLEKHKNQINHEFFEYDSAYVKKTIMNIYNKYKISRTLYPADFIRYDLSNIFIKHTLQEIEKTYNIRILYSCESGSRNWHTEDKDSDYDVRFVYMYNDLDNYLKISSKDGKQLHIGIKDYWFGKLDIVGFDLKETLLLLKQGNTNIYEWFRSHIHYYHNTPSHVTPLYFYIVGMHNYKQLSLRRMWYHYSGLFNTCIRNYSKQDSNIYNRKLCLYIIRAGLSRMYIEIYREYPDPSIVVLLTNCWKTIESTSEHGKDVVNAIKTILEYSDEIPENWQHITKIVLDYFKEFMDNKNCPDEIHPGSAIDIDNIFMTILRDMEITWAH